MKLKFNKKIILTVILTLILIYFLIYLSHPRGNVYEGEIHQVPDSSIDFLYDLTYEDEQGNIVYQQEIFDKFFEIIDNAQNFIIVDIFLFKGSEKEVYRNLADELTQHLIEKRKQSPEMPIYFITDYYNLLNFNNKNIQELKENNIEANYYSTYKTKDFQKESPLNYLYKLFKKRINHRKLIIADSDNKIVSLITSANPHDGSSPNSNTGIYIEEKIWRDIYNFEKNLNLVQEEKLKPFLNNISESDSGNISIQFLADSGLTHSLAKEIDKTEKGESIEIMSFLISDKKIINKLLSASERGVEVKIILDINKESFGKEKNGIPNQPVAEIINKKSKGNILLRWYDSHGEQFHIKMTSIKKKNNQSIIFLGSSHLVNYDTINYNSQADIKIIADSNSNVAQEVHNLFDRIWFNKQGTYTADYDKFKNKSLLKRFQYKFGQFTKLLF